MKDRASALAGAAWDVRRFCESIAGDPGKTRALIDTVRAVRDAQGPGATAAEEQLMRSLVSIANRCKEGFSDASPSDMEDRLAVLRELTTYAAECLKFRRSRDSFGGRRRSEAFEILKEAHPYVDLPDAVQAAHAIARSGAGNDFHGAMEFLKARLIQRREAPDTELVDALFAVVARTRSRSIATGALDFLVQTDVISEWEAMSELSEWKERNNVRF